jgi:hypothetical protein
MFESGTTIVTGLNNAFKLSGNYVRPAYPGFIVTKIPTVALIFNYFFNNYKVFFYWIKALWIVFTCTETTDSTYGVIRLNSSKHPQNPVCTNPEKIIPIAL